MPFSEETVGGCLSFNCYFHEEGSNYVKTADGSMCWQSFAVYVIPYNANGIRTSKTVCLYVFISDFICNGPNWEQPKHPSIGEQVK